MFGFLYLAFLCLKINHFTIIKKGELGLVIHVLACNWIIGEVTEIQKIKSLIKSDCICCCSFHIPAYASSLS